MWRDSFLYQAYQTRAGIYRGFGVVILLLSFVATCLVYTQGIELALGRDLPVSPALARVDQSTLLSNYPPTRLNDFLADDRVGDYGEPFQLRFSSLGLRMPLVKAQTDIDKNGDGFYIARQSSGHFLLTTTAKNGIVGDPVIYARQSWRTVQNPQAVVPGSNIFVDTVSGWRLMYRVSEVAELGDEFVIPDRPTSTLTLLFEEERTGRQTVIVADYVILQNIDL